jgi:GTPase-activator protein for Ras-like GTPase/BTB/POZ domain/Domain found in Dishevelled, Egl-10, and Pleckstrin (DEP)/Galactose oxidase, central domain/Kelch motif
MPANGDSLSWSAHASENSNNNNNEQDSFAMLRRAAKISPPLSPPLSPSEISPEVSPRSSVKHGHGDASKLSAKDMVARLQVQLEQVKASSQDEGMLLEELAICMMSPECGISLSKKRVNTADMMFSFQSSDDLSSAAFSSALADSSSSSSSSSSHRLRKKRSKKDYRLCFSGSEAVDWVQKQLKCARPRAVDVARGMYEARYFECLTGHLEFDDRSKQLYMFAANSKLHLIGGGGGGGASSSQASAAGGQDDDNVDGQGDVFARRRKSKKPYEGLMQLVATFPQLAELMSRVVDQAELSKVARALLDVMRVTRTTESCVHYLLKHEFESICGGNTCLRGNSLVTKIEAFYSGMVGRQYMSALLGDLLMRVINDKHLDLETNSNRIVRNEKEFPSAEAQHAHNLSALQGIAQEFVDRVTTPESASLCPSSIRSIAGFTYEYSARYLPEQIYPLTGGFVLLRLFNPAIVAPDTYGIVPDGVVISSAARNNLVSLSKLLQKLSNEKLFLPTDEASVLNEFIAGNRAKMRAWLKQLATDPSASAASSSWRQYRFQDMHFAVRSYNLIKLEHLVYLHELLSSKSRDMIELLRSGGGDAAATRTRALPPPGTSPMSSGEIGRLDLEIAQVLAGLGLPTVTIKNGQLHEVAHPLTVSQRIRAPGPESPTWMPMATPIVAEPGASDLAVAAAAAAAAAPRFEPTPRVGHVTAVDGDYVFMWGGASETHEVLADPGPIRFSLLDWTFGRVDPAGAVEQEAAAAPPFTPGGRMHASGAVSCHSLYVFAGLSGHEQYLRCMIRYDFKTRRWHRQDAGSLLPAPRYGHTAVFVDDDTMLVFGGYAFDGRKGQYCNDLWAYSIDAKRWHNIAPSSSAGSPSSTGSSPSVAPPAVTEHSAVEYDGQMYVFGGRNASNDPVSTLHVYDPAARAWRLEGRHGGPSGRWAHSATVDAANERMLIFGGFSGLDVFNDVWSFSFSNSTWQRLATQAQSPMPVSLHSAVFHAHSLVVFFGRQRDFRVSADVKELRFGPLMEAKSRVVSDYAQLVNNQRFSDVVFRIGSASDMRTFYAHRVVLFARAPELLELLTSNVKRERRFDVSKVSPSQFEAILRFIYTGDLVLSDKESLTTLVEFARGISLPTLVEACERHLCSHITAHNIFDLYELSRRYNMRYLLNLCRINLVQRAHTFVHSQQFASLDPTSLAYHLVIDAITNPFSNDL